jgi:hypothetical protein
MTRKTPTHGEVALSGIDLEIAGTDDADGSKETRPPDSDVPGSYPTRRE